MASRAACTAASGSSPFTWNTGPWMTFATSLGYGVKRNASGGVVKPTWLSTMMWIVPPVR